jgi:uncharacterized protein YkwD
MLFILFLGRQKTVSGHQGTLKPAEIQNLFAQTRFNGLHTAAKEFYLSEEEKLVIALCNLARYDGQAFIREVILPSGIDTSLPEINGLLAELRRQKSVFPLMPAFSLHKSALVHAKDMGLSGKAGHHSSDGKPFQDRIQQFFPANTHLAENYYQGTGDPFDIVMAFLLEKGERGKEYRRNLFSEQLHYIGISIQPHRKTCSNAVLDFAQKPQTAVTSMSKKRNSTEVYWRDCPTGTKVSTRRKSGGFSFSSLFGRRR